MKKFTMLAFLGAAAFGFVAVEATTTVAAAAEKEEKKLSEVTLKAQATKSSYELYRARKKGFGNLNKRWVQYLDEAKRDIPPIVKKIDIVGKEDLEAAHHVAWVYAEIVNRGEEPVEGVEVREVLRKFDYAKFVREFATEEELKNAVPAEALKAKGVTVNYTNNADLNAFKAAANRLGEDSIAEAAQKKIDAATK